MKIYYAKNNWFYEDSQVNIFNRNSSIFFSFSCFLSLCSLQFHSSLNLVTYIQLQNRPPSSCRAIELAHAYKKFILIRELLIKGTRYRVNWRDILRNEKTTRQKGYEGTNMSPKRNKCLENFSFQTSHIYNSFTYE